MMKEIFKFRINYEFANLLFGEDEGKNLGDFVKVIELSKNDPRLLQLPKMQKKIKSKYDTGFYFGWQIKRTYSKKELAAAALFQIKIKSTFEPAGEECGTEYDEKNSCEICGNGRNQIGQLRLLKSSIPKKDIARTIAGEVIVSSDFVTAFKSHNLKGAEFEQVYSKGKLIDFYQPIFNSTELALTEKTIAGIDPFDLSETSEGEVYKCQNGHTVGLNLLSEIYVQKVDEINNFDFFQTQQKIGVNRGLLRPEPLYLCSQKCRDMVLEEKLKGFDFEIAHV